MSLQLVLNDFLAPHSFLTAFIATLPEGRAFKMTGVQKFTAMLLIASLGIFAVAGTRDYLEWNRIRWTTLRALSVQKGIKPEDIDGGFEFNGWNSFDSIVGSPKDWAADATYVIAFGEIKGYEAVASYGYHQWMPPREGQIVVLKRKAAN